jgi:hypothetical protein
MKAGVERQMSLPKSGSKDKLGRVTKAAVKSKFKPAAKADKDKDQIPGESLIVPNNNA